CTTSGSGRENPEPSYNHMLAIRIRAPAPPTTSSSTASTTSTTSTNFSGGVRKVMYIPPPTVLALEDLHGPGA
ncbi:unnamed protein product, partial [Amoebophrya sp. A25]